MKQEGKINKDIEYMFAYKEFYGIIFLLAIYPNRCPL